MTKNQAEQLKEQGNAALKKGNAAEAVLHYTHAVKLEPSNHLLFSNRSLAFLKLDQYYLALQDANQVIRLQPSWPKGYFRKGEVEFKAGQYALALMSYKQAMILDPTDEALHAAVTKTNREMAKERKVLARQPYLFTGGGAGVGLLVVLADQFLTPSPSVQNPVFQVMLVSAFAAIGFGILKAYRYLIDSQTAGLLDPPPDLLGEMSGKPTASDPPMSSPEEIPAQNTHPHRKGGTAAARQRYRKAKS
ncbi:hsp70-Hsp90 organising protein-like isoform X2 [Babylonia areolata]|uniref:hsp70-Hsp90 organising protein-like isoform X2 n=1 Tax=Babylonia areolata TaxID=304850 RepID=UPI003FD5871D